MNNIIKVLKGFSGSRHGPVLDFFWVLYKGKKRKLHEYVAEKIGFVITVTSNSSL